MHNRYTGDIGDFGKFGLLRQLSHTGLSIGVNWYLTPDETHNGDGRHIEYLKKDSFRSCDEYLWQELGHILTSGKRGISALESPTLLQAKYYSRLLDFSGTVKSDRNSLRWEWHNLALEQLKGCNLIFVDPDNGLIVPSADGTRKSNKYVLPFELADYYRSGSSVIYYQHKARRPDSFYVTQHNQLLHSGAFPDAIGIGLKFKTTSQRYYFFLAQPCHVSTISACVQRMVFCEWGRHFSLMSCL